MNNFSGIGNLTREVETANTAKGTLVAKFTIAINRPKDANGETRADFINCRVFGKRAEVVQKYCHKGSKVGIIGKLNTFTFDDKTTGAKRNGFEIVVDDFTLLSSGANTNQNVQGNNNTDRTGQYTSENNGACFTPVEEEYNDLPF